MSDDREPPSCAEPPGPIAWVVPGPLRQVTGGYLYDGRIVDGLRARGWTVGVVDVRATRWPLDLAAGRRLATALRGHRWGAVVVDELAHPALSAAILAGRRGRARGRASLVLLVHHLRCSEPAPWHTQAMARVVERLAIRAADVVVCTSETTARTVRPFARGGVPVEVVRPGWDTHAPLTPHPPLPHGERRRNHLPSPTVGRGVGGEGSLGGGGHLRLLLVGHWTPRKGILDALAAVARTGSDVTLDLIGEQDRDPEYAERVRAALRDPRLAGRVRAPGRVSAGLLAETFGAADALILPSTHEGYGMVLAEALAAGLPIVAARVGAVPEVVRDGCEAELVPAGDVRALARAIERLAADPAERRRRSTHARERAATLPSWSDSVAAFDRVLRGMSARTLAGGSTRARLDN